MKRVLAAVALAFTVGGATAFTPSGALAATAPGPNAIPSDSLVQSINPDLAQVEEAGYRRKYRRHHGGSVMAFSFGVYPRPYPHSTVAITQASGAVSCATGGSGRIGAGVSGLSASVAVTATDVNARGACHHGTGRVADRRLSGTFRCISTK